jgi:hypothetical protein
MSMLKPSIIRFGSMDSWAGSRGRNPTVRLRHLRTTGTRILPSSTWSSSMNSFLRYHYILCYLHVHNNFILSCLWMSYSDTS